MLYSLYTCFPPLVMSADRRIGIDSIIFIHLVIVKFSPNLVDAKLDGVEVCDFLLIQPLPDDFSDVLYWYIGTCDMALCRMIPSIPRRLAVVISKGREQAYKEDYQNKV